MTCESPKILRLTIAAIASLGIAVAMVALLELAWRVAGRLRSGTWPVTRAEAAQRFVEKVGSVYEPHPYLVVRGRSNATLSIAGHEVHFNSFGQRGSEVQMPKPQGRYRILCIGGSTTFDLLARDDSTTWPARLGAQLGPAFDVVNAGFPGWTTVESLISMELRDLDTHPDLVIVFAGINDLQPASHRPFAHDYTLGHAEILRRVLGVDPIPMRFASRLVFIEWLLDRIDGAAPHVDTFSPAWHWSGMHAELIPPDVVAVFRRNLMSIIATARAHGAEVLVISQTVRVRAGNEWDRQYIESWAPGRTAEGSIKALALFNQAGREVAARSSVTLVDPFAGDSFTEADFGDPMHFSASGSTKFASRLLPFVRSIAARSSVAGKEIK
jgi:lysophospholipase L1-like esterase